MEISPESFIGGAEPTSGFILLRYLRLTEKPFFCFTLRNGVWHETGNNNVNTQLAMSTYFRNWFEQSKDASWELIDWYFDA